MSQESKESTFLSPVEVDAYYEHLVSAYWQQLSAFVLRRIGDPHDAEDIVQEAFVNAYYALERYSVQRVRTLQARAWLYKITWNVYLNFVTRHKPPSSVSLDTPEGTLLLDLDYEPEEQPEAIYERSERRHELEELLHTLPEQYCEALTLYYFDELSLQEVADLLRRPVGTVKTRIHRGLGLLKKAMHVQEEGRLR